MIDPSVTEPYELAHHLSGYAARLADRLDGQLPNASAQPPTTNELIRTLSSLAQGAAYIGESMSAAATTRTDPGDILQLKQLAERFKALADDMTTAARGISKRSK